MKTPVLQAICVLAAVCLWSCRQGQRSAPAGGALIEGNRQSDLQPGPVTPVRAVRNPFEGDEEAIGEGKRLFSQFNCAGCHAAGGGAIGPPLMDDEWTYGSSSANIFWTVIEGRPQGMPAFGGRIAEDQVWKIAAYVRSLSGLQKEQAQPAAGAPQRESKSGAAK
ncbi:MAG TPA: c-type cytochrome [Bryobacteraceae bacterium]|nr:c-type cytochrome [Bryobacteraceae bacterium]